MTDSGRSSGPGGWSASLAAGPVRLLALALLLGPWGCGGGGESFDPPAVLALPPDAVVASLGVLSDTTDEARTLSSVVAATVSASGRYLAIADRSAPFLRILDRGTRTARAFGPKGRGPGELLAANAVEFEGDSLLLVLSPGPRLDRFDVSGEWSGGHRLGESGLLVSAITIGCGGALYGYGVPTDHRKLRSVPWVHRLVVDSQMTAEALLEIPGTGYIFSYGGALNGFDGSAEGILVWHKAKEPQIGFWLPCDGGPAEVWSHTASEEDPEAETLLDPTDGRGGMVLTLPDTLFAGAAVRGSVKIRARQPLEPPDGRGVTTFHLVEDGGCREVGLVGEWSLHDAHADGLVLSRREPFPSVEIVDWSWFESRLTPARCAP